MGSEERHTDDTMSCAQATHCHVLRLLRVKEVIQKLVASLEAERMLKACCKLGHVQRVGILVKIKWGARRSVLARLPCKISDSISCGKALLQGSYVNVRSPGV